MNQCIDNAINWLADSGIRNKTRGSHSFGGVNNGYNWRSKEYPFVYNEITGYAISSFINIYKSRGNPKFLQYSRDAADYLIQLQSTEKNKPQYGAIPHSLILPDLNVTEQYWSFDNAIILQGLADLYLETYDKRYYQCALLIAEWLTETMQNRDGSFFSMYDSQRKEIRHGGVPFDKDFGCLHAKHAIALFKSAHITGNGTFRDSAEKVADWVLSLQRDDGAFWSNTRKKYIVTHSHCYAIEGLFYAYYILRDRRYLQACIHGADWLISRQYQDGALTILAGDIMPRGISRIEGIFSALKSLKFSDETAQAARIWLILHSVTGDDKYIEAADKALQYLSKIQCLESDDAKMIGGFYYKIDDTFSHGTDENMYTWCTQFSQAAFELYSNRESPDFYDTAIKTLF
jgi:uncharacterized protein YyaL (SSP411 family)